MDDKIWREIEKFKLPPLTENMQTSMAQVEHALIEINNYLVYISQFQPKLDSEIEDLEYSLEELAKRERNLILDGRLQVKDFPPEYRKNKELIESYIIRKLFRSEFEEIDKKREAIRKSLMSKRATRLRLDRMIKTARITIETGRSVLSALREENKFANLNV